MKRIILVLSIPLLFSCGVSKSDFQKTQDSLVICQSQCDSLSLKYESLLLSHKVLLNIAVNYADTIDQLHDSIDVLHTRQVLTEDNFIEIYKYKRLEKYYNICQRRPSQWKYYKGWSTRVFELK